MINSLVQYFIKNGHLELPGIGSLKWLKQESYWENNMLVAPKELITLDPISNKPEVAFFIHLSDDLGISVDQAEIQFDEFLNSFKSQTIASLTFGNLGTLHKNAANISWNNLYYSESYFKFNEPTIVSNDSNDLDDVYSSSIKSWVLWAITIAIVSIILIVYKQLL